MSKLNPFRDGIDHINIYSKGKTELGRFLSNFAHCPIDTVDGPFVSIEGYWYWLSTQHKNRDVLRDLHGFDAKALGRELGGTDWCYSADFKIKIAHAIMLKVLKRPDIQKMLCENKLPFEHYYVYGTKIVHPKEGRWLMDVIALVARLCI